MLLYRVPGLPPAVFEALPARGEERNTGIKPDGEPGRVVLVVMDYLRINDLAGEMPPAIAEMAGKGAMALMNANTGRAINPENAHATIGAGSHAVATGAYQPKEQAVNERGSVEETYLQRTGMLPPAGSLAYTGIARIGMINEELNYTSIPGALGEQVHSAGYRTAALGNSDDPSGPKRHVLTMVMDRKGIVDTGSVSGGVTRRQKEFPGGLSTDYDGILGRFDRLPADVKLVAIDLGDLARLQSSREYMTVNHWESWRAKSIARADVFLGELMKRLDLQKDLIILIAPTPGDDGENRDKMAPLLLYGGNITGGLLISPTTKRPGVVMNMDIAPTVLSYLGISGSEFFTGRSAEVVPGQYGIKTIAGMYRVFDLTNGARPYLQKGYVILQLVLLAVSLGLIFLKKKGKEVIKPFLLAVMSVPLAYLLMPLFPAASPFYLGALLILITVALTYLSLLLHRRFGIDLFIFISLATVAVITIDIMAGSPLQKVSVMSYDPIVGARFYGLGNEYMGVLIGSTLVGTTALMPAPERKSSFFTLFAGAVYLVVVYIIASPDLGTNVGGTIAAASAFLVTFLLVAGVRLTPGPVVAVALLVGLSVLGLTIYDFGRPVQCQSHIGRTASTIMSGGWDEVAGIINRKSEINLKLIKYTIWSRIFLASLGMLALLFYRPPGVMEGIRGRKPYLFKGLVGVITGSIVAFIFNDSGVVAAATTMIFGAPPLIIWCWTKWKDYRADGSNRLGKGGSPC
ncbi:MAG: alkaline phosphatase family protein [Desulfocucumaceae bacterium]